MESPKRIGSYELIFPIARGGMGVVFLARKLGAVGFERLVVVKRVHDHLASEPEFRAMLIDEARLSSFIRHPNVVSALDVIEESGEVALVLEYVEAVSLSQLLSAVKKQSGGLDEAIASKIVCDTLSGLHAAHEARDMAGKPLQIIHRDVSPQNVLVGLDGVSRLIDFGIAKAVEHSKSTTSGVLKGKLRYMSPEHVRQRPLDRRSDLFSCGCVLYEALCGRPAFAADNEAATLLELLVGEVPKPTRSGGAPIPEPLSAVLDKALALDPDLRFATAAEFKSALSEAFAPAPEEAVGELVRRVAGSALEARRQQLTGWLEAAGAGARALPFSRVGRRRRVFAVLALGGVTLSALAAAALVRRGPQTKAPPADSADAVPSNLAETATTEGGSSDVHSSSPAKPPAPEPDAAAPTPRGHSSRPSPVAPPLPRPLHANPYR